MDVTFTSCPCHTEHSHQGAKPNQVHVPTNAQSPHTRTAASNTGSSACSALLSRDMVDDAHRHQGARPASAVGGTGAGCGRGSCLAAAGPGEAARRRRAGGRCPAAGHGAEPARTARRPNSACQISQKAEIQLCSRTRALDALFIINIHFVTID